MRSQTSLILEFLLKGKALTNKRCLEIWGYTGLAQSIFELREKGHKVKSKLIKDENGRLIVRYSFK